MIFLGIDQSLTSTGCCVISETGEVLSSDIISSQTKDDVYTRTWSIMVKLLEIITKYDVTHVALEGLAFAKTGNATRSLAILQGVIVCYLKFQNSDVLDVKIIPPNCLKKFATGKGKASKTEMMAKVPVELMNSWKKNYKKTSLDDLADAYFLAQYILPEPPLNLNQNKSKKSKIIKIKLKLKLKNGDQFNRKCKI